jgi:Predicted membrane protein
MGFINSVQGKILIGFIAAIATMYALDITNSFTITVWIHVLAGIVWIGLLYYFNFVQVPGMGQALADTDGPGPAAIGKYIAPRALLWFRMAAATTWLVGLSLLAQAKGVVIGGEVSTGFSTIIGAFTFEENLRVIGLGSWMGTIMAFNVWFIIWPNQQKDLRYEGSDS